MKIHREKKSRRENYLLSVTKLTLVYYPHFLKKFTIYYSQMNFFDCYYFQEVILQGDSLNSITESQGKTEFNDSVCEVKKTDPNLKIHFYHTVRIFDEKILN